MIADFDTARLPWMTKLIALAIHFDQLLRDCMRIDQLRTARSFPPFPCRITICRRTKSKTLTLRRQHSLSRMPVPYISLHISLYGSGQTSGSSFATSSRDRTTGRRCFGCARWT